MYIRRIAETTSTFTQGKLYKLNKFSVACGCKPHIINDKGNKSYPAFELPKYWEQVNNVVAIEEINKYKFIDLGGSLRSGRSLQQQIDGQFIDLPTGSCPKLLKYEYNNQEEIKMLKIEKVTLVNGTDVKELKVNQLIHHIKNEEQKIEQLNKVKSESKAIARIKKEHESNIEELTKILDNME